MAWVEFSTDFHFRPPARRQICIFYRAGLRCSVLRECADAAIAAGAACEIPTPARGAAGPTKRGGRGRR